MQVENFQKLMDTVAQIDEQGRKAVKATVRDVKARAPSWIAQISIHALREEGDAHQGGRHRRGQDFYPRPPRGGRQQKQRQNLYFLINYTTFCTNLEEP